MSYGGKNESPGKTRVRSWGYEACGPDLWNKTHIVIASRDCGDIKFLLNMGVKPLAIIACDIDPVAVEAARQYGVIISPYPSIESTVAWAVWRGYDLGSINIDLCDTVLMCEPIVEAVMKTVQYAGIKVVVLFTYQRGRDKTVLDRAPNLSRDTARITYLVMESQGRIRWPDATTTYISYTSESKGSTMGVCMWKLAGRRGRKRIITDDTFAQWLNGRSNSTSSHKTAHGVAWPKCSKCHNEGHNARTCKQQAA